MKFSDKNIWEHHAQGKYVVIPCNIGYDQKGVGILGAGLAKQASVRYPNLPKLWGAWCKSRIETEKLIKELSGEFELRDKMSGHMMRPLVLPAERLILVATKRLNVDSPHLSWKNDSDMNTVLLTIAFLHELVHPQYYGSELFHYGSLNAEISIPMLGCGLGNLKHEEVMPELEKAFKYFKHVTVCTGKGK